MKEFAFFSALAVFFYLLTWGLFAATDDMVARRAEMAVYCHAHVDPKSDPKCAEWYAAVQAARYAR